MQTIRSTNSNEGAPAGEFEGIAGPVPAGASIGGMQLAQLAIAPTAANTLLAGSAWSGSGSGATVITYSFATTSSFFGADAAFAGTLSPFSDADKALVREVLASISAVCDVQFVEAADDGAQHGQIRYAYSAAPNEQGYAGFAFFPGTAGCGGDVWIGADQAASQWDWYRPDLLLHETLHAIGLKHPFDGAATLDTASDVIPNTVMSYSALAGSHVGSMTSYPDEPMALDISALQALYSVASHNEGDTVYDLGSAEYQANFHAIWDSGGTDTFDASHVQRGVVLDLREGGRSDIGVDIGATAYFGSGADRTSVAGTYTQTITIAQGTTIEKAIGSAYDDTIVTSSATRDVDGGAGVDTVVFEGSVGDYTIAASEGSYQLTNVRTQATTQLEQVERIEFSDAQLQSTSLVGVGADSDYAQAFRLYKAALDRVPDQGGIIFQTRALESGTPLQQLAANFIGSPEFQQHYSGVKSSADFVALLYANVLDRAPDAQGLAYHVNLLDSGAATRADVLVGFSESPENQADTQALLMGAGAPGLLALV